MLLAIGTRRAKSSFRHNTHVGVIDPHERPRQVVRDSDLQQVNWQPQSPVDWFERRDLTDRVLALVSYFGIRS